MDLSTMKRKLDSGQYPNAAAFESDFKLLIHNCSTYNPPRTPVHDMGQQLASVFYEKWQQMPQPQQEVPQQQQQQGWGYGSQGPYGGDSNMGLDNEQISLMQRQLELLTGNLEMLKAQARMKSQPSPYGGSMGMQMQMPGGQYGQMPSPMQMSPPLHMQQPGPPPMQQQQQQQQREPAPKAARPPAPPKVAKAPAKRKSSGSFSSSLPSAVAQANAPPKPRTTKRSSAAARATVDTDYAPPSRGGRAKSESDYEEFEPEPENDLDDPDHIEGDIPAGETPVTFDMKRELAEKIQEFDGPKLDMVVEIIRRSAPELLGDDNKEIELDIDMLDQRTLLKLYEYVVRPVNKGRQLKPKKNKVKGRNRGVDEVAEEERINALQAQLDAMEGSVAGAAAAAGVPVPDIPPMAAPQAGRAGDVASSSSEDEDDGSESESDGYDGNEQ